MQKRPYIGYRSWWVGFGYKEVQELKVPSLFSSSGIHGPWIPGINTAQCFDDYLWPFFHIRKFGFHTPPARSCACGLYAFRSFDELASSQYCPWNEYPSHLRLKTIAGATVMWGKVRKGMIGFRAQYACVAALYLPQELHFFGNSIAKRNRFVSEAEQLSKQYGVPLASTPEELHSYAAHLASWMAGDDVSMPGRIEVPWQPYFELSDVDVDEQFQEIARHF